MSEIKMNLTITLPGSVLLSKQECFQNPEENCTHHTMEVHDEKGKNKETITYQCRKTKNAKQSINICKESYDYMVSNECPSWAKMSIWRITPKNERLKAHLRRICESLGGISFNYNVFED